LPGKHDRVMVLTLANRAAKKAAICTILVA
jgi:hypothetical protein